MVIRIRKNKNYTTMSNHHLKDKNLSFKAKGLLSMFLSLPDDWDYSVNGIVSISKESETSVTSTLKELKNNGYLEVVKLLPNQTKTGRIEYEYNIYEIPKQEGGFLGVEFQGLEFQGVENVGQLNTNKQSTKNKKEKIIKEKDAYGEFKNVLLTKEEYEKIKEKELEQYIERLSVYIESKGIKYRSHYATILNWSRKDNEKNKKSEQGSFNTEGRRFFT